MRPDVLVGPSEWVVEQFGDKVAAELWTRVPEALSTAIDREVNAHPATTQTTERVLANPRWPLPYEELVLFLGTLPGAKIISVPKSVYQLVVINGHVVVPWCYGQSARMSMGDWFAGAPHVGLLRACLGEVKSTDNGSLDWSHLADLPLPPPVIPRPRRMQFP
jgi:hypothetical protein